MDWESIEKKWSKKWKDAKLFQADPNKNKKFFATFPYPYVNGPAHLGHGFTFARVDCLARFKRMNGFNVLFPQGFHATGEPIAGVAERVSKGDEKQIKILQSAGVTKKELENFKDPEYIAKYWVKQFIEDLTKYGGSIDWRRKFITTPLTPAYSRFIEWQYNTLKRMGYVVQGTHPVIWCPNCESPTGAHDRLEGENATVNEFTVLKFPSEFGYFAAATLRPETVFGVVNMWVDPEGEYVAADVEGDRWILSKEAAQKLDLQKEVKIVQEVKGKDLVGEKCKNPVLGNEVKVYPASFVDTSVATGVVMSVPSHAPYDWVGVLGLKEQGIEIEPISIIETEGLGEHPGIEICEEKGITEPDDPRLEEVTKKVYKKEFHKGTLKENCGDYAGIKVSEIKDIIIEDFKKQGIASKMYECSEQVVCRCDTECLIKILKNQWFLKFSDPDWKEKVNKALDNMKIIPKQARAQFEYTINWLKDKACARRGGLGTPLPWDKTWIVETLSDSTIYMAYYTIAKYVNDLNIQADKLTDGVLDYIFLGKGKRKKIAKESGLGPLTLKKMREEFEYWYPVDFRCSAKELIPNHLTFFLFHHTAVWPEDKWPRMIATNGMLTVEGEKMSKSKGNWVILREAIEEYGSDPVRLTLLYAAEGMSDSDWSSQQANSNRRKLEELLNWAGKLGKIKVKEKSLIDDWLMSRIQLHIELATDAYERTRTRSAIQSAFYDMYNDFKHYLNRQGGNKKTIRGFLKTIALLMAPVTPFFSEEMWHKLGGEGFISVADWPERNEDLADREVELGEVLVKQTIDDLKEIKKLIKTKPKKVFVFVAPEWKQKAVKILVKNKDKHKDKVLKMVLGHEDLRPYGNEIVKLVTNLMKNKTKIPEKVLGVEKEIEILKDASEAMKEEMGAMKVEVLNAEEAPYDPKNKCRYAMPFRPALYIE